MLFDGPVTPFGAMVEISPYLYEGHIELHQFGPEVLPGVFFGCVLYAGRIWKGDIMVADIEELVRMDASEIHARRLNAKGSVDAAERLRLHIPNRRWFT